MTAPGELGIHTGLGDEWLRIGVRSMAIDGGTTPHTAYMYEPFEGKTEVKNYNRLSLNDLRRFFRTANELGWDVGIHCCGDHAEDLAVDASLTPLVTRAPVRCLPDSIIHAELPTHHALEQMARRNIAAGASSRPSSIGRAMCSSGMLECDGRPTTSRRGTNRTGGVPLAASSDEPSTVSVNPFVALYVLVTRKNKLGQLVLAPQEAISRLEALQAYTVACTCWRCEEGLKGTIEAGKLADLAVLDRDYFAVPGRRRSRTWGWR